MLIGELVGDVSTEGFTFEAYKEVKKFDFVAVKNPKDGKDWILAQIDTVTKSPEGKTTADATIIGYRENGMLKQPRHVIKPDSMVYRADEDVIAETLGLTTDGLYMGKLETNPDIRIFIDPSDLYKHIAVLAQTGAGKCVSGETPVMLSDGSLKPIKQIFEENAEETVKSSDDEELVRLKNTRVQSLNEELQISTAPATFAYRKKAAEVVEITTASGRTITTSKEHPLLCANGFTYREAAQLDEDDFIAVPRKTSTNSTEEQIQVSSNLKEESDALIAQRQTATDAYEQVMEMHSDGKRIGQIAETVDAPRSTVENWLYNDNQPVETSENGIVTDIKGKQVDVPTVSPGLGEFFALLIAEGTEQRTSHYRAMFTNHDNQLLERFETLCRELFGLEAQQNGDHARYVDSNALEAVLQELGYQTNRRSRTKAVPDIILSASKPVKQQFLKTFADCEGWMDDHEIVISTASDTLANQLTYLLLDFGIVSRIRTKEKRATNAENHDGDTYYEISISGLKHLERFSDRIGFGMTRKQKKLDTYITSHEGNTNVDTVPIDGTLLRQARTDAGLSQKELANIIGMSEMSISRYENENRRPSRKALSKIAEALDIDTYSKVCDADVQWDRITDITVKDNPNEYVYDLTVADDHTFIAGFGGIVNHNSYATGVMLEELLEQDYPVIIIDPHGEYHSLAEPNDELDAAAQEEYGIDPKGYDVVEYTTDTDVNPHARKITFSSKNLTKKELEQLVPTNLTNSQTEVLYTSLKELRERDEYTLQDVMDKCKQQESKAKWNLISVLEGVMESDMFADNPTDLDAIVQRGQASIINLRGAAPEEQEMVVYMLAKELFERRKVNDLDPFIMVMEEAHNFVPERNFGKAVCSDILRTIASEGRKFGLGIGVISQRPARVDKNILSQCNTQLILRVNNSNDLSAISRSFEGVTSEVENAIKSLPPGTGLVLGKEYPVMTDVRTRRSKHGGETQQLSGDTDEPDTATDTAEPASVPDTEQADTATSDQPTPADATPEPAAAAADTVDAAEQTAEQSPSPDTSTAAADTDAPDRTDEPDTATAQDDTADTSDAGTASTEQEAAGTMDTDGDGITAVTPAVSPGDLVDDASGVKTAYYPLWVVSAGDEKIAVDGTDGEIKARETPLSDTEQQILDQLKDGDKTRGQLLESLDVSLSKLQQLLDRLQEQDLITETDDAYAYKGVDLFDRPFETVTGDDHTEISVDVGERDAVSIAKQELSSTPESVEIIYYPYYTAGQRVFDAVLGQEI